MDQKLNARPAFISRRIFVAAAKKDWGDGIPLDGRDIWSFVLQCNDAMENMWILKPETLRNLGRNHRPRCWPWSNGTELPIDRAGIDRFHTNYDEPVLSVTCIGPFGCVGEHEHVIGAGGMA